MLQSSSLLLLFLTLVSQATVAVAALGVLMQMRLDKHGKADFVTVPYVKSGELCKQWSQAPNKGWRTGELFATIFCRACLPVRLCASVWTQMSLNSSVAILINFYFCMSLLNIVQGSTRVCACTTQPNSSSSSSSFTCVFLKHINVSIFS